MLIAACINVVELFFSHISIVSHIDSSRKTITKRFHKCSIGMAKVQLDKLIETLGIQ